MTDTLELRVRFPRWRRWVFTAACWGVHALTWTLWTFWVMWDPYPTLDRLCKWLVDGVTLDSVPARATDASLSECTPDTSKDESPAVASADALSEGYPYV